MMEQDPTAKDAEGQAAAVRNRNAAAGEAGCCAPGWAQGQGKDAADRVGEMVRPRNRCRVRGTPGARYFKPAGIPLHRLSVSRLDMSECESIRLADDLGLTQEEAARRMGVSQPTFNRIVNRARTKIARAIVGGHAIAIDPPPAP